MRRIKIILLATFIFIWLPFLIAFFPTGANPFAYLIPQIIVTFLLVVGILLMNKRWVLILLFVLSFLFSSISFVQIYEEKGSLSDVIRTSIYYVFNYKSTMEDLSLIDLKSSLARKSYDLNTTDVFIICLRGMKDFVVIVDTTVIINEGISNTKIQVSNVGNFKRVSISFDNEAGFEFDLDVQMRSLLNSEGLKRNYYTHELLTPVITTECQFMWIDYDYFVDECWLYKLVYVLY